MEDKITTLELELNRLNAKLIRLAWKIDDVDKKKLMEHPEGNEDDVTYLLEKVINIDHDISIVKASIENFQTEFSSYPIQVPEIPATNLISHTLWKRMLAVFGHGLVGNVLTTILITLIITYLYSGF